MLLYFYCVIVSQTLGTLAAWKNDIASENCGVIKKKKKKF